MLDAYHAACARTMLAYDGFIGDFRGDGILPILAIPAHTKTTPSEACGLGSISLQPLRDSRHVRRNLAVRIGIATGLVVVGGRSSKGALQSALWSGTRRTLRPASGWPSLGRSSSPPPRAGCSVICSVCATSAGTRSGVAEPISAWAVEGVLTSESRFEAVRAARLTDFIGRENELDFLLNGNASPGRAKGKSC